MAQLGAVFFDVGGCFELGPLFKCIRQSVNYMYVLVGNVPIIDGAEILGTGRRDSLEGFEHDFIAVGCRVEDASKVAASDGFDLG